MGLTLTLAPVEGPGSLHKVWAGPHHVPRAQGSPPGEGTGLCGQAAPVGGLAGDLLGNHL